MESFLDTSIFLFDSRHKITEITNQEILEKCPGCHLLINEATGFNFI
jgi:hypothetical protein